MYVHAEQRRGFGFKEEEMQPGELVSVLEKPYDHLKDRTPGPDGRGH